VSYVTDMILVVPFDHGMTDKINEACHQLDEDRHQQFRRLDAKGDEAGGTKVMGCDVWAMGGNYFPWYDLIEVLEKADWVHPGALLYVYPEDGPSRAYLKTWDRGNGGPLERLDSGE